ncbi:flavodoxin family protein [Cognatilysobacter bugurensis]|uniref:FMN reductase n=1 Tax=Cognatilysobacter bugurensis TaxID=543356 RepID=A0A918SYS1_9GAMM|nr:flavodoxin family protein [Lysobacter bugurensis]GHA76868.1 FMN reductase [Lysobacter bugurensis]
MNPEICVVFHSGFGHTQRVAEAIAEGSQAALLRIDEAGELPSNEWEKLSQAKVIVFGSPTYMGNVSWQFKKFLDASSAVWARQGWRNKLAAGFTNSAGINGDKHGTLQALFTVSQQHGMIWLGTGLMPSNTKGSTRDDLNFLASFSGLMAATPADAGVDEVPKGDLATALAFGARVREVTALFAKEA